MVWDCRHELPVLATETSVSLTGKQKEASAVTHEYVHADGTGHISGFNEPVLESLEIENTGRGLVRWLSRQRHLSPSLTSRVPYPRST